MVEDIADPVEEGAEEAESEAEDNSEEEQSSPEDAVLNIDKANLAAERMEKANEERKRLLKIEENLLIERKLAGSSDAGKGSEKPKELTPVEYRAAIERGEIPK